MPSKITLNTRTHKIQLGYAKKTSERVSAKLTSFGPLFLHADKNNLGILEIFYSLKALMIAIKYFNIISECCYLTIKNYNKLYNLLLETNKKTFSFNEDIIYLEAMRSTLAKRTLSSSWEKTKIIRRYAVMMLFDNLMANRICSKLKQKKVNEYYVFNGRVMPEYVFQEQLSNVFLFESQSSRDIYIDKTHPVSLKRYENHFSNLTNQKTQFVSFNQKKCIIFLTSPYEYIYAGRGYTPKKNMFPSQEIAVDVAIRVLLEQSFKIKIKGHPNAGNDQSVFLNKLSHKYKMISIVNDDPLKLIDESDFVCVSSSSLAIDGAKRKKIVAHLSPSFYHNLGVSVYLGKKDHFESFLNNPFIYENHHKSASIIKNSNVFEPPVKFEYTMIEKVLLKLKILLWSLK